MARIVQERPDIVPVLAELFREHGYEGASLALIGQRTGLGKGSLYHFFPGGKEEMANAVLAEIEGWFEANLFRPLHEGADPMAEILAMFSTVTAYFQSGRRICLVGLLALADARERFAQRITQYFIRWQDALANALTRAGKEPALAEEIVAAIQGALVLARATYDSEVFSRTIARLQARVEA
ncbi:TetR/AcrR family transcriptional regulator [Geminicoccus roseus]|uniref:TetR/AcrR family transcriptional regulator n=1 Tax=Geminicoccus roseus TaxID=404900 RepID=UPI000408B567|nr:TetR/AcrR family transcriptional regulator [Geminicoccus roseus]